MHLERDSGLARNEEYFDGGDCILETGDADWTTRPTAGGDPSTARIKWLAVWHRQPDGDWKIVRDIFNSRVR